MTERGLLRNPEFAKQERDFRGVRFGACTMTDIDGYLELGDRFFCFVEAKFGGRELPRGQCLALERLVDAIHLPPTRYATALIVDQWELAERVDYAALPVRCYRWCGRWCTPSERIVLVDKIHALHRLSRCGGVPRVLGG